jgi:hypothetical protein
MPGQGRRSEKLTRARQLAMLRELEDRFAAARVRVTHLPREADPRLVAASGAHLTLARTILDRLWSQAHRKRRRPR